MRFGAALYRKEGACPDRDCHAALVNDWRGTSEVNETGNYYYTPASMGDRFKSWRHGFAKKVEAGKMSLSTGWRAQSLLSRQQSLPRATIINC
jgi:hypothetical protein